MYIYAMIVDLAGQNFCCAPKKCSNSCIIYCCSVVANLFNLEEIYVFNFQFRIIEKFNMQA